jgi:hypothetical protein
MVMKASTINTASRVLSLRRDRCEFLDEYYRLRDRALKLQQFRFRDCAAGIGVMCAPGPIRDWDREKELYDRIDAKTEHLYKERARLLSIIQDIEAELGELPYVENEDCEEFD